MNIMTGSAFTAVHDDAVCTNSKPCITCGAEMARPRGEKRISDRRWQAKLFCSRPCIRPYDRDPDADPAVPVEISARIASRNLLKALVRYGLRHDGLPGLPAARLLALASELGVVK